MTKAGYGRRLAGSAVFLERALGFAVLMALALVCIPMLLARANDTAVRAGLLAVAFARPGAAAIVAGSRSLVVEGSASVDKPTRVVRSAFVITASHASVCRRRGPIPKSVQRYPDGPVLLPACACYKSKSAAHDTPDACVERCGPVGDRRLGAVAAVLR